MAEILPQEIPEDVIRPELTIVPEIVDQISRFQQAMHTLKRAGQGAIVAAEVSPLNETVRYSLFGASMVYSQSPLTGALVLGGSTLVIEGAAALASASLISSENGSRSVKWINGRLEKVRKSNAKMGPLAEAGTALIGGSAVAMAATQLENPDREIQETRKYGLKVSSWLAGICAVQGALMANGIDTLEPTDLGVGVLSIAGLLAAAKWAKNRPERTDSLSRLKALSNGQLDYAINEKHKFITREATMGSPEAAEALELERKVWKKYNFGDAVEEYKAYDSQTQMYIARDEKEVIGIVRMFKGSPKLPPFMDLSFDDEKEHAQLVKGCEEGIVEELGTAARMDGTAKSVVSAEMWRLAYRNAHERGVKKWGIIMEPERVHELNNRYGLCFKQVGPTENYQGGDCAPHVLDLQEVESYMLLRKPHVYWWFSKKKLTQ